MAVAQRQVLAVGSSLWPPAVLLLGQADEQRLLGVANAHAVLTHEIVDERNGLAALFEHVYRFLIPVNVVDAIRLVVVAYLCFVLF